MHTHMLRYVRTAICIAMHFEWSVVTVVHSVRPTFLLPSTGGHILSYAGVCLCFVFTA